VPLAGKRVPTSAWGLLLMPVFQSEWRLAICWIQASAIFGGFRSAGWLTGRLARQEGIGDLLRLLGGGGPRGPGARGGGP